MPNLEDFPTIGRILVTTTMHFRKHVTVPCIVVGRGELGLSVVAFLPPVPPGDFGALRAVFGGSKWPSVGIYPVSRGRPEDVGTEAGFHKWVWPREVPGDDGKIAG